MAVTHVRLTLPGMSHIQSDTQHLCMHRHTQSTTKVDPAAVQQTGPQIINPSSEGNDTFHFPLQKLPFLLLLHTLDIVLALK